MWDTTKWKFRSEVLYHPRNRLGRYKDWGRTQNEVVASSDDPSDPCYPRDYLARVREYRSDTCYKRIRAAFLAHECKSVYLRAGSLSLNCSFSLCHMLTPSTKLSNVSRLIVVFDPWCDSAYRILLVQARKLIHELIIKLSFPFLSFLMSINA